MRDLTMEAKVAMGRGTLRASRTGNREVIGGETHPEEAVDHRGAAPMTLMTVTVKTRKRSRFRMDPQVAADLHRELEADPLGDPLRQVAADLLATEAGETTRCMTS